MEREFVPYEQASSLIALGFNEPVIAHREHGLNICLLKQPEVLLTDLSMILFQQAFRWFREEHGHNGVVEGCKKHGFEWCIFPDMEHYIKPPNNFNTYEEAELACLEKLIEIMELKSE